MGKLGGFAEGAQITGDTFGVGDHGEHAHAAKIGTIEEVLLNVVGPLGTLIFRTNRKSVSRQVGDGPNASIRELYAKQMNLPGRSGRLAHTRKFRLPDNRVEETRFPHVGSPYKRDFWEIGMFLPYCDP